MIEDRIRDYITRTAQLPSPPADRDRLVDRGFVPSVRLLDLIGFLEDEFSIRLRAIDIVPEKLATIEQIASVVRTKLSSSPKR
jgi:acyl carrier protein